MMMKAVIDEAFGREMAYRGHLLQTEEAEGRACSRVRAVKLSNHTRVRARRVGKDGSLT